jgi:SAM-dependent methyltransferase
MELPLRSRLVKENIDWIDSKVATQLKEYESRRLNHMLPDLHGHYLLQYSAWNQQIIKQTTLKHNFFVGNDGPVGGIVDYEQLPFRDNALDCVFLHHILDYSEHPHQALREAARVVVPNGYMVLIGFNPFSSWMISRHLPKGYLPSTGRFISSSRVSDWLALLGFRVEQVKSFQLMPPFMVHLLPKFSRKVERFLNWIGIPGGAMYIVVARKLVAGRTPVRPQWKVLSGRRFPVATPSARGMRVSNSKNIH